MRLYYDLSLYFSLPGLPLTLSNPFPAFSVCSARFRSGFRSQPAYGVCSALELQLAAAVWQSASLGAGLRRIERDKVLDCRSRHQSARPSPQPFNPRPVPQFDDINQVESRASSSYHSLQVRLQQRLVRLGFCCLPTQCNRSMMLPGFSQAPATPIIRRIATI
jgi:hypothetical protein